MKAEKYKAITSQKQYDKYNEILVGLLFGRSREEVKDEMDLLTSLLEQWDDEHNKTTVKATKK